MKVSDLIKKYREGKDNLIIMEKETGRTKHIPPHEAVKVLKQILDKVGDVDVDIDATLSN
jgi:hypothetical protein